MTNYQAAQSISASEACSLDNARQIFWMMANYRPKEDGETAIDWSFRVWIAALEDGEKFTIKDAQQAASYAYSSNPAKF